MVDKESCQVHQEDKVFDLVLHLLGKALNLEFLLEDMVMLQMIHLLDKENFLELQNMGFHYDLRHLLD